MTVTMDSRNRHIRQRIHDDDSSVRNCCNCDCNSEKPQQQQQYQVFENQIATTRSTVRDTDSCTNEKRMLLKVDSLRLHISFKVFAVTTVCLPLLSMLFCFVTSMIFQFEQVNHTFCKVRNFIPSISAITGIAPQRYVWRVCIGLHSTPRLVVAFMYWNYFLAHLNNIAPNHRAIYKQLVRVAFWLNITENACLIGVTYVSNVENYPLHEKIFIVFMVASIAYMLLHSYLFKWSYGANPTETQFKSLKLKLFMLSAVIISTIGLLYFFYKHRIHCEPGAFSWFAFCEYGIAVFAICYHFTGYLEFMDSAFILGTTQSDKPDIATVKENEKKL